MTTALRVGAAKADISPVNGIQIAGDIGRYRPCTGIIAPIYARALVLEQAGRRFCVLTLDLLSIDDPWAKEVRRRVAAKFGIPPAALLIHPTQNHAAPALGHYECRDSCRIIPEKYPWLRGGDPRYNEPAVAGILAAIGEALAKLSPVTIAAGRAIDNRVAFNRRYVMRDGTALCQPAVCDPNILHVEGPIDPEVGVVTFTGGNGQVVAALLHHTCHPCTGFAGNEAHPDWPGAWCNEMETHFGSACTPLVINGCCGNIIHRNFLNPDEELNQDYRLFGRQLAESTEVALHNMAPISGAPLGWASEVVPVPRRQLSPELLAEVSQLLRDHPEPLWSDNIRVNHDWVYAVGITDLAELIQAEPNEPYEIQAVRVGEFALLGLMGEPFVEAQLNIKRESPFAFTQVAHMCNGYVGYIPTRHALARGGYETRTGWSSRLAPEALEMIGSTAGRLLRSL
ncbi:MAG: hypothetical protein PCFJNLEI_00094 [Verrucomicrobiae bacterium]|nr:hypothetical protein [Verrucomicrobiae bacterium]